MPRTVCLFCLTLLLLAGCAGSSKNGTGSESFAATIDSTALCPLGWSGFALDAGSETPTASPNAVVQNDAITLNAICSAEDGSVQITIGPPVPAVGSTISCTQVTIGWLDIHAGDPGGDDNSVDCGGTAINIGGDGGTTSFPAPTGTVTLSSSGGRVTISGSCACTSPGSFNAVTHRGTVQFSNVPVALQ